MTMLRRLVALAVVVLIGHAGWKIGPVYLSYFEFKTRLEEIARFSADRSEAEIQTLALTAAKKLELSVTAQNVRVRKVGDHTYIDVAYRQALEVLPRYQYPQDFAINVQALQSRVRLGDVR